MMISNEELQRGMTTTRRIWYTLFASLILYVYIVPMAFDLSRVSFPLENYRTLRLALFTCASITVVVTWLLRKYLLSVPQGNRPIQSAQHPAVGRYLVAMVVAMGLSESIGVYGLVLYILGKNHQDLYLLTVLSAAAMLLYFPKKQEILTLAKRFPPQDR